MVMSLSACSSYSEPNVNLKTDGDIHKMSRHEVINAISECQDAGFRPVMIYGRMKVNNRPVGIVLDVTCVPASLKRAKS